jgi:hypothetical protein
MGALSSMVLKFWKCSSGQCVSGGPSLVGLEALAPALRVLLGTCRADNRDEAGVSLKRSIHL